MEPIKCPSCQEIMKKIKKPDITIDRCPKCGGTFLDKGELNTLATGMAGDIEMCSLDVLDDIDKKTKHPIRNCPKSSCNNNPMKKIDLLVFSDTIFDYCEKCGGFFLDKGEIQDMNLELEKLNKNKVSEEFRDTINDHLVRLDKIAGVVLMSSPVMPGVTTRAQGVDYLRLSVYFIKPLNLGLRIFSEKWTDKFVKMIGLFNKQDIQIGDEKIDSSFVIQGNDKEKIKSLFSSADLKKALLDFQNKKVKMYVKPGSLEIGDKRLVYTEGPYSGETRYDVKSDRLGIVRDMLNIAKLIEG